MQLHIRHETHYEYEEPVSYSIQALKLTPRADPGQRILSWRVLSPGERVEQVDPYGNLMQLVTLESPHRELRIVVEGVAEGDGVAEAMRGGGTLVVPSRYEVAPVAIAEAWAIGLPVVATAVGGVPALARGAAALCEAEDPAALAAGIVRALERGGETELMVTEGRKRAEAHRVTAVADAHIALYERLLG